MRILIFGDIYGIPRLLSHIPKSHVCGIVAASIRSQYHEKVEEIARENGLPLLIQPLPSSNAYIQFKRAVETISPDLIWVCSYSMIVREDVLAIPRFGGINIHGALLPQYRGCNPTEWAIINGEYTTGVTLHEMSSGVDEGSIIDQKFTPLYFDDTWRSATDRVDKATDRLIAQNLGSIITGKWCATAQDESKAKYHRRRHVQDGRFRWTQPILEIYNLVRALVAPHPGASYLEDDGSCAVISCYKSLAELTLMKSHRLGNGFLRGDKIRLRPIKHDDIWELVGSNEHRWQAAFNDTRPQVRGSDARMEVTVSMNERSTTVIFAIEENVMRDVIGICRLSNINPEHRSATAVSVIDETLVTYESASAEVRELLVKFAVEELELCDRNLSWMR